jgi:hypothetical protein
MEHKRPKLITAKAGNFSARQKATPRPKFQPQFFAKRLALFEPFEKLFQNAHHDCIDADALLLRPSSDYSARLGSDMQELGFG